MPAATVDHSQRICEVWASNLDEEMKRIRQVTRKFNYIAMVSFKVLMLYSNILSNILCFISSVSFLKCDLELTVIFYAMKSDPYVQTVQC